MLSELRLRNMKCFAAIDVKLAPLTLLTGVASAGKSTVMQAFLLMRQSHVRSTIFEGKLILNDDLARFGAADMLVRDGESELRLAMDWASGETAAFAYKLQLAGSRHELDAIALPDNRTVLELPPFTRTHYLSAERLGPRAAYPTSELAVVRNRDVGPHGEFTAHFLHTYGDRPIPLTSLKHAHAATQSLRGEVEAWMGLVSPNVNIITSHDSQTDVCSLTFTYPGAYGRTSPQRATHVGFGVSYVLPIIVSVLSSNAGDLLLIENPEAHLHPRAQRELVTLLARAASAGVQVVVETHSDHILNGVRLAVKHGELRANDVAVHFLATGAQHAVPTIDSTGAIRNWPAGFFDEWDVAVEELLRA